MPTELRKSARDGSCWESSMAHYGDRGENHPKTRQVIPYSGLSAREQYEDIGEDRSIDSPQFSTVLLKENSTVISNIQPQNSPKTESTYLQQKPIIKSITIEIRIPLFLNDFYERVTKLLHPKNVDVQHKTV